MQEWVNIWKSVNAMQHVINSKYKNHVTPMNDAEKAFDKIHCTVMINNRRYVTNVQCKVIQYCHNKSNCIMNTT
jgi:hypothetical protein